MKKLFPYLAMCIMCMLFSCQKEEKQQPAATTNLTAEDVIAKLKSAGFDTSEGLMKYKDGYLVEHDIYFTLEQISKLEALDENDKPKVEHYRTNNLVTGGPRTLNVYMDAGFGSFMQNAFDVAIARYNSQHLSLTFQRVTSSAGAHISIFAFYEVSNVLGYSAGFPSGGNPASPIYLNTYYYNNNSQRGDAATVIAHEIGHAIGFRHTDYMNRAFSCGSGGNEGDAGVGANPIPYTPTGPSADSWMLACSSNTDRPFTLYDRIALVDTYPGSYPGNTAPVGSIISLRAAANNKYVCAEDGGASALIANRDAVGLWEQFLVVDAGNGLISLQAIVNNAYVCTEEAGALPMIANRTAIGSWEKFRWINNSDGTISLQSTSSNSYVCAEDGGASPLIANRPAIGAWEVFYYQVH